jgi:hypothetical protein
VLVEVLIVEKVVIKLPVKTVISVLVVLKLIVDIFILMKETNQVKEVLYEEEVLCEGM